MWKKQRQILSKKVDSSRGPGSYNINNDKNLNLKGFSKISFTRDSRIFEKMTIDQKKSQTKSKNSELRGHHRKNVTTVPDSFDDGSIKNMIRIEDGRNNGVSNSQHMLYSSERDSSNIISKLPSQLKEAQKVKTSLNLGTKFGNA